MKSYKSSFEEEVFKLLLREESNQHLLRLSKRLSNKIKFKSWVPYLNEAKSNIPFEELLQPFAFEFQVLLSSIKFIQISENVKLKLRTELLNQLSFVSSQTLYLEYKEFTEKMTFSYHCQSSYKEYIKHVSSKGLAFLFKKYPVLERLLCYTYLFWKQFISTLLKRIYKDRKSIKKIFGKPVSKLIDISENLSDAHNNRQFVVKLNFESNLELIYKPKPLKSELCYNKFLKWISNNSKINLKHIKVLSRKHYGWTECMNYNVCSDLKEVQEFYFSIGCLLFLVYLLGGHDYHFENLIADGINPVIIDLESLFLSPPSKSDRKNQFRFTVFDTDLLPLWLKNPKTGEKFDVTGIGSRVNKVIPYEEYFWINPNSDHVMQVLKLKELSKTNLPSNNLEIMKACDLEIENGFKEMYLFFFLRKKRLQKNSVFNCFRNTVLRHLIRPTRCFKNALIEALSPYNLKNEISYLKRLNENLNISLYKIPEEHLQYILYNELKSLWQLDIPLFRIKSDQIYLYDSMTNNSIKYFSKSGFCLSLERLTALSNKDLTKQLNIIKKSLQNNVRTKICN